MGNAHPGCWTFIVYTDDDEILRRAPTLGLGEHLDTRMLPRIPHNLYDFHVEEFASVAREREKKGEVMDMGERDWLSVSRSKLDLVDLYHLKKGEKVFLSSWCLSETHACTHVRTHA